MTTTDLSSNTKPVGYLRFAYGGRSFRCNRLHADSTPCDTMHYTHQEALDCTEMHHESEPETT